MGKNRSWGSPNSHGLETEESGNPGKLGGALALTVVFLIGAGLLAMHHEPWRDEVNTWLIPRENGSPLAILRHLKYEGHPGLWYLLLFYWAKLFPSMAGMRTLHLLTAGLAVFLLAWQAPFSWKTKVAITVGYFPAYEYAVISRNYVIGVVLLFAVCTLFQHRRSQLPAIGGFLFLASHTSVYATIVVFSLGIFLLIDRLTWREKWRPADVLAFSLIFAGIVTTLLQIAPAPDAGYSSFFWAMTTTTEKVRDALNTYLFAMIPIPRWESYFWNSSIFSLLDPDGWMVAGLSLSIWFFFLVSLRRKPLLLGFYALTTLSLWAFQAVKFLGFMRHWGFHGIILVITLWLEPFIETFPVGAGLTGQLASRVRLLRAPVLSGILLAQTIALVIAGFVDWNFPFSRAGRTADYLRQSGLIDHPLAGDEPTMMVAVAGNIDRTFFAPRLDETWKMWKIRKTSFPEVPPGIILAHWAEWAAKQSSTPILVTNYMLSPELNAAAHLKFLASFQGAVVVEEQYAVYSWNP